MQKVLQTFIKKFPRTEANKTLAPLNTIHIGGRADLFYKVTDLDELPALIEAAKQLHLPVFVLGGGSNTIFADEGFRGLVLHIQAKKIALEPPYLVAEAGALLSQVIQFALKNGLSGMEKLMGLPGTIGGAVRGNAGAFGVEIKDIFAKALICKPQKGILEIDKNEMDFQYRYSRIKKTREIIMKVYLLLEKKDCTGALAEALDIVKNRISKQPKGYCSGSFFKNPPGLKAGYLLEKAGCKSLQVGQIKVSDQHANWLINLGGGTQKEVIRLASTLQQKVCNHFGIKLEKEVQLLNETGFL